jgi:hypothetical protein
MLANPKLLTLPEAVAAREKLHDTFAAMLSLACILLWLQFQLSYFEDSSWIENNNAAVQGKVDNESHYNPMSTYIIGENTGKTTAPASRTLFYSHNNQ